MRRTLALSLTVLTVALAACGDDDDDSAAPPEPAATSESATQEPGRGGDGKPDRRRAERPGTEIVVSESQYGSTLFNSEQQAIYLFDKEESDAAECYGDCAAAWPPVVTDGDPQAGRGVDEGLLGTTRRDDGSTQVTYNGHPLYYYAHEGPGQVLCQNVEEFGGLWLVVQPSGEAVT
jgi:predicted lipoprotein with Yx(FWY)xxD motif